MPLMTIRRNIRLAVASACIAAYVPTAAQSSEHDRKINPAGPVFITLGTNAGAIPRAGRKQPSNLLSLGDLHLLIDAGDGVGTQLAAAGISLRQIHHVFLSHLHMDHIGGLFALLGQRSQIAETSPLTVFGPPGTRQVVDSLCAATRSAVAATDLSFYGTQSCANIVVTELRGDARFSAGSIAVTTAANTHYSASDNADGALSLSFRFDTPTRSIVYTGDTGPSGVVETLAKGADLLVTEIIDPQREFATVIDKLPNPGVQLKRRVDAHFRLDHLSAAQVATLAQRAGVRRLVLTHIALDDGEIVQARRIISASFRGKVTFARDMDRF